MRATRSGQGMVTATAPAPRPFLYVPTVAWAGNTIAGATGAYIKMPGLLILWISFQETVGSAAAALTVTLPTGYTAITLAGSLASGVGYFGCTNGVTYVGMSAVAGTSTQIISNGTPGGAVGTFNGMFIVPTLT